MEWSTVSKDSAGPSAVTVSVLRNYVRFSSDRSAAAAKDRAVEVGKKTERHTLTQIKPTAAS
jgi:hypothetical protein